MMQEYLKNMDKVDREVLYCAVENLLNMWNYGFAPIPDFHEREVQVFMEAMAQLERSIEESVRSDE